MTPTAFRYEMTSELLAEAGPVDRGRLRRADGGAAGARPRRCTRGWRRLWQRGRRAAREQLRRASGAPTRFTGYETEEQQTTARHPLARGARGANGAAWNGAAPRGCWSSSPSRPSMPPAAARSPTSARSSASTATAARASGRLALRRGPGDRGDRRAGDARGGRGGARACRPARATCDRVQPHRHPPAPGGAARASRAATFARPAPTSARTSCASTSATARR